MKDLMRKFIVFLIRCRLGLEKEEHFRFIGQKSDAIYYFTEINVMKREKVDGFWRNRPSGVSLNWLLNPDCSIEHISRRDTMSNWKGGSTK